MKLSSIVCADSIAYPQGLLDIEPLMIKYGVDFLIAGHEHSYESSWPTFYGNLYEKSFTNPKAPIHIVTGSGGPPGLDSLADPMEYTRLRMHDYGYSKVIAHNYTHFEFSHYYNSNDTLFDHFVVE